VRELSRCVQRDPKAEAWGKLLGRHTRKKSKIKRESRQFWFHNSIWRSIGARGIPTREDGPGVDRPVCERFQ
jgi:hypothetical protein